MHSKYDIVFRALRYAADVHRGQLRKGKTHSPYINHLIEVTDILWRIGGVHDPAVLAAGLLHDTVEDTDLGRDDIAAEFGGRIADIVMELTDDMRLPKPERKRLQAEHAPLMSMEAKLIKLADKISNIGDVVNDPPAGWDVRRRREYVRWGMEVAEGLRGVNSALEERFDALSAGALGTFETGPSS